MLKFDVELDEVVPVADEGDGANMKHFLGSLHRPPHTGSFHAILHTVTAGTFGHAAFGRSTEDAFDCVSVHVGESLTSSENRCGSASGRGVLGTAIFLLETVI